MPEMHLEPRSPKQQNVRSREERPKTVESTGTFWNLPGESSPLRKNLRLSGFTKNSEKQRKQPRKDSCIPTPEMEPKLRRNNIVRKCLQPEQSWNAICNVNARTSFRCLASHRWLSGPELQKQNGGLSFQKLFERNKEQQPTNGDLRSKEFHRKVGPWEARFPCHYRKS